MLEQKIGRCLISSEIAHHVNENKLDNNPENLEIKIKQSHVSYHLRQRGKIFLILKCPECKNIFEREKRNTHIKKNSRYTTCSRSCRGKFVRRIQLYGETEQTKKSIKENVIEEVRKFSDVPIAQLELEQVPTKHKILGSTPSRDKVKGL